MGEQHVQIVQKDGESMVEAMLRTANERAKEEIAADIKQEPVPALGRKAPKPRTKSKPTAKRDGVLPTAATKGGDPNSGSPTEEQIVSCIHFYTRPDETPLKVAGRARHEREMHGPNTLIFSHGHKFGEACSRDCKVRVEE